MVMKRTPTREEELLDLLKKIKLVNMIILDIRDIPILRRINKEIDQAMKGKK